MIVPFKLEKPYIIKKIEPIAFKVACSTNYQTAYRLYLIANEIKEIQPFFECEHPDFFVIAHVKTEAAAANMARQQIWSIKHLQPLMYKKPRYVLKCVIKDRATNKTVYRSEITSINQDVIYEHAQLNINKIKDLLKIEG